MVKPLIKRKLLNYIQINFFADEDQKFYEHEIMKLNESWQKIIDQNGIIKTSKRA